MSDDDLVTVVTVCLNSAATIQRTIDSVRAQTHPRIQYVVVDGGSTDGTLDILSRNGDLVDALIVEPDDGLYDAMNKGVAKARGAWVHILNSDDCYASADALARALPLLDHDCTNTCDVQLRMQDGRTRLLSFDGPVRSLFVSAHLPHAGLVVSREQYRVVGGYDARLRIAADHDLILRLLRHFPLRRIPVVLADMYQGGTSSRNLLRSYSEFRDVTKAHGMPSAAASAVYWAKRLRFGAWPWRSESAS